MAIPTLQACSSASPAPCYATRTSAKPPTSSPYVHITNQPRMVSQWQWTSHVMKQRWDGGEREGFSIAQIGSSRQRQAPQRGIVLDAGDMPSILVLDGLRIVGEVPLLTQRRRRWRVGYVPGFVLTSSSCHCGGGGKGGLMCRRTCGDVEGVGGKLGGLGEADVWLDFQLEGSISQ